MNANSCAFFLATYGECKLQIIFISSILVGTEYFWCNDVSEKRQRIFVLLALPLWNIHFKLNICLWRKLLQTKRSSMYTRRKAVSYTIHLRQSSCHWMFKIYTMRLGHEEIFIIEFVFGWDHIQKEMILQWNWRMKYLQ